METRLQMTCVGLLVRSKIEAETQRDWQQSGWPKVGM